MEARHIERLERGVSVIGLGTWQLGADWGDVDAHAADEVLETAHAAGVTFCAGVRERHPEVFVATKMGRRVDQRTENYNRDNFLAWNDRSRQNLNAETLDLVQLHCPPDGVFADDAVFDALDAMVAEGRLAAYGVSVETCEQALAAIARPHIATVQLILNCFRLKPLERVLPAALQAGVGIIVRVPLASGLLSGRYDESTTFDASDHRSYNRSGEAFDVGETFAGVPFEVGVAATRELAQYVDDGSTLAQFALRWVIDQPGVSTVIPGARNAEQVTGNVAAAALAPLREDQLAGVSAVYDRLIREHVHDRW
jgi:aryl-alcohol dehydrogenase-like predicted oxidoreductase